MYLWDIIWMNYLINIKRWLVHLPKNVFKLLKISFNGDSTQSILKLWFLLADSADTSPNTLDEFRESLSKFTRFSNLRNLAVLSYATDLYNSSSIVSSIEFDRDCDYFAIAGVTKKIKVNKIYLNSRNGTGENKKGFMQSNQNACAPLSSITMSFC